MSKCLNKFLTNLIKPSTKAYLSSTEIQATTQVESQNIYNSTYPHRIQSQKYYKQPEVSALVCNKEEKKLDY